MKLANEHCVWSFNYKLINNVLLILLIVVCTIPVLVYGDDQNNYDAVISSQTDSAYRYKGAEYYENMAFLLDSANILEFPDLRTKLDRIAPENLNQRDQIILLFVKDLTGIAYDAIINLQHISFYCPDTLAMSVSYASTCRAYDRTMTLAPLVRDPILQMLTHDLRIKLRLLALKIEKLMWGHIPTGRDEPFLYLWMQIKKESRKDSSEIRDK